MEFILKNKYIELHNQGYIPEKDLSIPIKDFDRNYKYIYHINNLPGTEALNGIVMIPKEILITNEIFIKITIKNNQGNVIETFSSDKIKLRRAFLLGEEEAECYPTSLKAIHNLIRDIKSELYDINKMLTKLETRVTTLEEEGDLL